MKRICLLFSVALLSFGIGTVATWSYYRIFSPSLTAPVPSTLQTDLSGSTEIQLSGHLQIDAYRLVKNSDTPVLEIDITNGSSEPVYYTGYSKHDNCSIKVKRDNGVEDVKGLCWCGTGLGEQSLTPGESTTIFVDVRAVLFFSPDSHTIKRALQKLNIGFEFLTGQERQPQTLWIEAIKPGDYLNRQTFSNDER